MRVARVVGGVRTLPHALAADSSRYDPFGVGVEINPMWLLGKMLNDVLPYVMTRVRRRSSSSFVHHKVSGSNISRTV